MQENDSELVSSLLKTFNRLNGKLKLLNLLTKAKLEYDKHNFEDCKTTCEESLKLFPQNSIALRGLGCVAQSQGDYKKALEYYKLALKNSETKEIEYTLIGTLYYLQDNFEKAVEYYNMAIDVNDDYDPAYEGKNQSILERHLQIVDLQESLIKRKMF